MTKAELMIRATELEAILDFALEESLPSAEEELCKIYGMLQAMGELEEE